MWASNWLWGAPIIALNLTLHVLALGRINRLHLATMGWTARAARGPFLPAAVLGLVTLGATLLHAIEAGVWALAYLGLGAIGDARDATLYSLNAITTYGHTTVHLAPDWEIMGAIEALNGLLMFGLTTAFLYSLMQRVWPPDSKRPGRTPPG